MNYILTGQLRFRNNHSIIHALIIITDHICHALDIYNIACGISTDFQKTFDTVDHEILLKKLAQFVSIDGYESSKLLMTY